MPDEFGRVVATASLTSLLKSDIIKHHGGCSLQTLEGWCWR